MAVPDITHVPECFACGDDGLGLVRSTDGAKVYGEITLQARHSGLITAHGGIIMTLLDDVCGSVPQLSGHVAVTGTLEVRFLKPGVVGRTYKLTAWLVSEEGRRMLIKGEMAGEEGLIATAHGTWIRIRDDHYEGLAPA